MLRKSGKEEGTENKGAGKGLFACAQSAARVTLLADREGGSGAPYNWSW